MPNQLDFLRDLKGYKSALVLILGALAAAACDFGASTFEIVDGSASSGDGDGDMGGDSGGDGDGDIGDGDGDIGDGDIGDGDGDTGGMPGDGDGDTGGMSGDGDGDLGTGGNGTGGDGTGGDGTGGGVATEWDCGPFGQNTNMTVFDSQGPELLDAEWMEGPYLIPDGPNAALAVGVVQKANQPADQQEIRVLVRRITDSMDNPLDTPRSFFFTEQPPIQEIEQVFRTASELMVVGRAGNAIRELKIPVLGGGDPAPATTHEIPVPCDVGWNLGVVRAAVTTSPLAYAVTCHSEEDPNSEDDDLFSLLIFDPDSLSFDRVATSTETSEIVKHFTKVGNNVFLLTGDDTAEAFIRTGTDANQLAQMTPIHLDPDRWTSLSAFPLQTDGLFFVGAALTIDAFFPADGFAGTIPFTALPSFDVQTFYDSVHHWGTYQSAQDAAHLIDAKPLGDNVIVTGPSLQGNSVFVQVHGMNGELIVRKRIIDNPDAFFGHSAVAPFSFATALAYREGRDGKASMIYCGR